VLPGPDPLADGLKRVGREGGQEKGKKEIRGY